ncbi:MAG: sialate O-acetylesterase [Chitinophagaceae bacterium]
MPKLVFFLLFSVAIYHAAYSKVSFPAIVGDNMVLQQQSTVMLWGWSKKGSMVTIVTSWNKKTYKTEKSSDGKWKMPISTPIAGGPYTISFNDGELTVLDNILIGEVWLCSGQSNMEMPVKGFRNQRILNSNELLLDAENESLRFFLVQKNTSKIPLEDVKGQWQQSSAATIKQFSAVAYQFGRALQQKLKVPVGLIGTYWGGTPIQAWMSVSSLNAFPEIKLPDPADTARMPAVTPTLLFNAMINPLVHFPVKGFLWYQGESNVSNAPQYEKLMGAMVGEWRKLWGSGESPFYFVQIAPYSYGNDSGRQSAYLREAQLKSVSNITNTGMAVSLDAGTRTNIHPPDKTVISKRLLYLALVKTYGKTGIGFSGPVYKSMKVEGNKANINFDFAENGLSSFEKELSHFEIAGEDRMFYPASASITQEGLVVQSVKVQAPVAVRYAFKNWVIGDLYNTEGLPASSFRTDNW